MEKNKIIIIALIIIVAALLVGLAATMPNFGKQDTKLKFKSNSTLTEGDSLKVKLTDANGTALANQTVKITFIGKNGDKGQHSVVTNEKGVGTLKLDKNLGKYNVTITYKGNDKFNPSNATKKITIKKEVVQTETTSQSETTSSESSSLPYSVDNLPPSNDPYPETKRYQIDEYHVRQEYSDDYHSIVDLRTGERHGGFGN